MDFFNSNVLINRKYTSLLPRSYVYSSNRDAIVLKTDLPETRLTYVNQAATFVTAASSNAFVLSKDSNPLFTVTEDTPTQSRLNVHGVLQTSNLVVTPKSNKQIVLDDPANGANLSQFAGFGYTGAGLYYQTPNVVGRHVFQTGVTSTLSKELMRVQYNGVNAQVGIGITDESDFEPLTSLKVVGGARIVGDLVVTGNIAGPCNFLRDNVPISTSLLPSGIVYLSSSNKIDDSFLPTSSKFQSLKSQKNVGIGTNRPAQKLHVQGSLAVTERIGVGTSAIATPKARLHAIEDGGSVSTVRFENTRGGRIMETYMSDVSGSAPVFFVHGTHPGVSVGSSNIDLDTALSVTGNAKISGTLTVGTFAVQTTRLYDLQVVDSGSALPLFCLENLYLQGNRTVRTMNSYVPFIARSNISTSEIQAYNSSSNILLNGNVTVSGRTEFKTDPITCADSNLMQSKFPIESAVAKVLKLHGYMCTNQDNTMTAGMSAQELEGVIPQAVKTLTDGTKGIQYDGVIALLIEAVKELATRP